MNNENNVNNFGGANPTPNMTEQFQQQQAQMNQTYNTPSYPVEDTTPISMWGYVGYMLLFTIPCIGFIAILIFAFGNKNVNVKNFARAYLVLMVIAVVLGLISALLFGAAISSLISSFA